MKKLKPTVPDELKTVVEKKIEAYATREAAIREVEVIYRSLISIAEAGINTINLPNGTWKFVK